MACGVHSFGCPRFALVVPFLLTALTASEVIPRSSQKDEVDNIKHAADGMLVELVPDTAMAETKQTHDRVEEWLEKNWGRPGEERAEAKKEVSKRTIMSIVDPEKLPSFIANLALGDSVHPNTQEALKKAMQNVLLSRFHSDGLLNIKMDDAPGGKRFLEKFALKSKKMENGDIAIVLSYFSDVRTLSKDWMWLVNNHKSEELQKWLDYKLHVEVEKKALSLSNSNQLQRLAPPSSPVQIEHELYNAAESGSEAELQQAVSRAEEQGLDRAKVEPYKKRLQEFEQQRERKSHAYKVLLESAESADPVAFEEAFAKAKAQGIQDEDLKRARANFDSNQLGKKNAHVQEMLKKAIDTANSTLFETTILKAQDIGFSDAVLTAARADFDQSKHIEKKKHALKAVKEAAETGDADQFFMVREKAIDVGVGEEQLMELDTVFQKELRKKKGKSQALEALENAARSGKLEEFEDAKERAILEGVDKEHLKPMEDLYRTVRKHHETSRIRKQLKEATQTGNDKDFERARQKAVQAGIGREAWFTIIFICILGWCLNLRSICSRSRGVPSEPVGALDHAPANVDDDIGPSDSASQTSSQNSLASWSLVSAPIGNKEPDCYFATAVFRRYAGGPDPELVCPPALQLGDNVAALGGDVVKVSELKEGESSEMIRLTADNAVLEVTPTHRISVPNMGSTGSAPAQVPSGSEACKMARELQKGDYVVCEDGVNKQLTNVEKVLLDKPVKVYSPRFTPDLPVPVFSAPPNTILSKGMPSQPSRRGGSSYQRRKANRSMCEFETRSIPETHQEISD